MFRHRDVSQQGVARSSYGRTDAAHIVLHRSFAAELSFIPLFLRVCMCVSRPFGCSGFTWGTDVLAAVGCARLLCVLYNMAALCIVVALLSVLVLGAVPVQVHHRGYVDALGAGWVFVSRSQCAVFTDIPSRRRLWVCDSGSGPQFQARVVAFYQFRSNIRICWRSSHRRNKRSTRIGSLRRWPLCCRSQSPLPPPR